MSQSLDAPKRMTVKEFLKTVENLEETIYQIQMTPCSAQSPDCAVDNNKICTSLETCF